MVNLEDWDLPVPNWIIYGWLGLLEAIILIGMSVFIISLVEEGGIVQALPFPRGQGVILALVLIFTAVFTVFRMENKSIVGLIR